MANDRSEGGWGVRPGRRCENPTFDLLLHGVEASSCGITIADATQPDMPLIYVNPAFETLTGYSSSDVIGRNCRFLQGTDVQPEAAYMRECLTQGIDCAVTLRNYRKDGTLFWNELTISPIQNAEGLVTHFIGVQADITRRVKAEEALVRINEELEERVLARTAELQRAYEATLEGWAKALDLRDNDTEGHSQRVTEMTMRLARKMGLTGADLVNIRRGALLHDIGKIGIPDQILLKPGCLTAEERVQMQAHPVLAYEWLQSVEFLRPALQIPYSHHERWDGTGYPKRLKGEQIPLAARIFAVVDVWDALRSDRPYRLGWPDSKVVEYIREQSGTHFDPAVVDAFLELLAEDDADASKAA